jgi:predicted DNA-binding transcriptional regulator YafY
MDSGRIHRLLKLITVLQSGTSLTAAQLADRLSVSRRTLFRDFKALAEAGIPYRYQPARGYDIEPSFFLPPVNLKVNEALGLMLLARTADSHRRQPFHQAAVDGVQKLAATLPAPYRQVTGDMLDRVSVVAGPSSTVAGDADHFVTLQRAIDERRVCRMVYDSLFDHGPITTDLHPYHLHYAVRAWYVIGKSELHREDRTFKLARIRSLAVTGRRFRRRRFDIHKYLGQAWSLIPEGKVCQIELEFEPKVARNVSEVRWHASQQHELTEDGRCIMRFEVDGLNEITWWLLGYGDQVLVRKPAALRDRLRQVHEAAARRLAKPKGTR